MEASLETSSTQQSQPTQVLSMPPKIEVEDERKLSVLAQSFIEAFKQRDPWTLTDIAQSIRRIVSKPVSLVQHLIETGVVVYIIKIFDKKFFQRTRLLMECSWIMINIAADQTQCVKYIVKLGVIQKIQPFLRHPDMETRRNVIWVLTNIIGESNKYKIPMFDANIIGDIIYMLESFALKKDLARKATSLICELVNRPYVRFVQTKSLAKFIGYFLQKYEEKDIISKSLWALSYISDGNESKIQEVLDLEICSDFVRFARMNDLAIQTPALRIIGNLVTGNESQTNEVLASGAVEVLAELLESPNENIIRESCWVLSNILAGNMIQIATVLQYNEGKILRKLIELIQAKKKEIVKECLWCISNMSNSGSPQQMMQLVDLNIIQILVNILKTEQDDSKNLTLSLEALRNILHGLDHQVAKTLLEESGSINALEKLQEHQSKEVSRATLRILENYFEIDV